MYINQLYCKLTNTEKDNNQFNIKTYYIIILSSLYYYLNTLPL